MRSIHADRLTSGLLYQRPVNPKEVERLIREWDERLLDPVTVSFRDGRFYVVDGQYRISAMRKMNGGFLWVLGKSHGKIGEIMSTHALLNSYRLLGGASFTRMLQLLWDAWEGDPRSLTAAVLSGMALFVKTYDTEINDKTFISQLSQCDPDEINRRGRADFSTSNTALRFARVILEKYNGQRGGKKLPYRFRG